MIDCFYNAGLFLNFYSKAYGLNKVKMQINRVLLMVRNQDWQYNNLRYSCKEVINCAVTEGMLKVWELKVIA